MELKPGYKQTEVGVIPEDWEIKLINQICTPSNARINPLITTNNYKCIELEHLSQGTGQLLGFADSNQLKSQKTVFKIGDVLFGKLRPYLKKYYFSEFEGVCTTEIWVLNASSDVVNKWLYFTVQSDRFLEIANQSTGTKMPRAEWPIVGKALTPFPPTKTEQTAIANALSDADALIQSLTRLIAKKRQIKQGAMQTLLNPYENGRLKAGWVVKLLGDVAYYRRGSFPQPYGLPEWFDEINGTPFVQVYDVDSNMRLKSSTKQKISDLAKDKSVFVKEGTVILTIQGSIGRIAVTQYDSYVDRTLLIFTGYQIPMDDMFFAFIVQEKFRIEKENAPGGIIKTITKEALSKFDLHFPNKQEQTRIATILSDMDTEIAELEAKLAKYRHIKQGMMQNLLTGRIRLVEPETKTGAAA